MTVADFYQAAQRKVLRNNFSTTIYEAKKIQAYAINTVLRISCWPGDIIFSLSCFVTKGTLWLSTRFPYPFNYRGTIDRFYPSEDHKKISMDLLV